MAKKQSIPYREYEAELNRRISQQDFPPVTLICGEQDYLRSQNLRRLRDAILGGGDPMNSIELRGSSVRAAQIMDMADTMPFLAERRVITIRESSFFEKPGDEPQKLAEYLNHMPETSFLIFEEPSPNASYRLYRAIAGHGFICRCDTPDDRWIRSWTASLFEEAGMKISGPVLNVFLQGTGTDLMYIRQEADKLTGYCLGRTEITREDVDAICSRVIRDRIFDMIGAISNGQRQTALEIYMDLRRLQTPPQVILSLMQRQYTQLLQAKELLERMSEREAAAELRVNPWVFSNRLCPALRGTDGRRLERALEACIRADVEYKSGRIAADTAAEELVILLSGQNQRRETL